MPVGPRRGRRGCRVQSTTTPPVPTTTNPEKNLNMTHVPNMAITTETPTAATTTVPPATAPAVTRSSIIQTNQNPDLDNNTQNLVLRTITTELHAIVDTMFQRLDSQAEALAAVRLQPTSTSSMAPPVPQTPLSIPPSTRSMAREVPYLHTSKSCAPAPTNRSSPHVAQPSTLASQPAIPVESEMSTAGQSDRQQKRRTSPPVASNNSGILPLSTRNR